MEVGTFAVLVAFLCAMFYTISLSRPAVKPRRFLRKSPHIRNNKFLFALVCLRLHFFLLFILLLIVDFRVALADPLAQIGSILDRTRCHCWSNFPACSAAALNSCRDLARNFARNCRELAEN